jgi:uncharacterized protein YlxW (UPF0749 family)
MTREEIIARINILRKEASDLAKSFEQRHNRLAEEISHYQQTLDAMKAEDLDLWAEHRAEEQDNFNQANDQE